MTLLTKINWTTAALATAFVASLLPDSALARGGGFYVPPSPEEREHLRRLEAIGKARVEESMAKAYREKCERMVPQEFVCIQGDVMRPTFELTIEETNRRGETYYHRVGAFAGPKVGASALVVTVNKNCAELRSDNDPVYVNVSVQEYFKATQSKNDHIGLSDFHNERIISEAYVEKVRVDISGLTPRFILSDWTPLLGLTSPNPFPPAATELQVRSPKDSFLGRWYPSIVWGVNPAMVPTLLERGAEPIPDNHVDTWGGLVLRDEQRYGVRLTNEPLARVVRYNNCFRD